MNDSADMNSAKAALNSALDSLEASIGPVLSRMKALEAASNDSSAFREDRTKLAAQLDEMAEKAEMAAAKAQEEAAAAETARARLAERETEFSELAQESEAELDRVMGIVRGVLGA